MTELSGVVPEVELEIRTKDPCAYCGKKGIGIQIYGCCSVTVCADHADEQLKAMQPGERKDLGACYMYRFPEPDG